MMKWKYRLALILTIYAIILLSALLTENNLENQLSPNVFENPTMSFQFFMDDFIRVKFSCFWTNGTVNFIVQDEFGNMRHNSSLVFSCEGFKIIDLQGVPQDYLTDRKYLVLANFDNRSIRSEYFYFEKYTWLNLIKKEIFSFLRFAILENRLARGAYTDQQRMLYTATGDDNYGKNYLLSHLAGFIFTFSILLTIDLAIWIFVFFKFGIDKARGKKSDLNNRLHGK